jgi:hypothetical protein
MRKNHWPEVICETASEYPGSLWLVGDDGFLPVDAVPPDGKS